METDTIMPEEKASIVFNISGGNNQILPNATHAEQHFHGVPLSGGQHLAPQLPDVASRLSIYIGNEDERQRFMGQLSTCRTAAEVGRIAVQMVQAVPGLSIDDAKTQDFINILIGLATSVATGTTVTNFRKAIDTAWFNRKI